MILSGRKLDLWKRNFDALVNLAYVGRWTNLAKGLENYVVVYLKILGKIKFGCRGNW